MHPLGDIALAATEKIIVIGAGIGGLACALRLAHQGFDVTVLEAQGSPGGKMRTLPSPAGPVDAGPTVMTLRPVFEELFASVGETLSDHVTLIAETILARHWWHDGSTLDLDADPEISAANIRAFAGPRAEADFRAFSTKTKRLFEAFDAPMMQSPQMSPLGLTAQVLRDPSLIPMMAPLATLAGRLARQFRDPRLAQLYGRYATYVGGSPFQSPAILALISHAEAQGVWRVKGGMHRLAQTIAALAETRGARFRYNTAVTRFEVQQSRIAAVHTAEGDRLPADAVVFNGDPRALVQGHLGPAVRSAVPEKATEPRSLSAYVWAFAATPDGPDLAHHNVFFGQDPRAEFDALRAGDMPRDPTLYVCAQDRGTNTTPTGAERFEIILNGAASETPKDEFQPCQTLVFDTLARFGLTFDPPPGPEALTTPAGFNQLFPASAGSLYGRSPHGLTASFARPTARSAIPGLYLTGGGTHPGAGIPMATLSARHAAAAIMTDLASTSTSPRTAMPGGMSTGSAPAAPAPSASSVS